MSAATTDPRLEAFGRLLQIMNELREQCPWDRKQTMESLRILTLEETYELAEAILEGDLPHVKEELGDLMLHLVFYAKIGEEKGAFTITDVLHGLCDKLVARHPHIYGQVKADTEEQVKQNWEQIKLAEGKGKKSVLGGVPGGLPSLVKAYRIQDKAKQVGFEWENAGQVWKKVEEELTEFKEASELPEEGDRKEQMEKEFGDVIFSLVNYARFKGIDPEAALEKTNRKFIARFHAMEEMALAKKQPLQDMGLWEMDALWNEAKKTIR